MDGFSIYIFSHHQMLKKLHNLKHLRQFLDAPEGILLINIFLKSSLILSVISVLINPGETQFILIFFFAYSIAKLLEKATMPALDAA